MIKLLEQAIVLSYHRLDYYWSL